MIRAGTEIRGFIGWTECAPAAAPGGHLHDAERGARLRHHELVSVVRMFVRRPAGGFACKRAAEQVNDLGAFGATPPNDAEFLRCRFPDPPCAGSAQDGREAVLLPAYESSRTPPGIQR